jgi:hypothetical protein
MMKLATLLAGVALALTGATAASAGKLADRGEAKLARMLEGRVAGEPVKCINGLRNNRVQVIEEVGLVYDAGDTIYVSRPTDPKALGRTDIVMTDQFGSQLCTHDVRRTVDRYQGYVTGPIFLQDFVPYTKRG